MIEYDLDSRPVRDPGVPQYSERVIHGEIYKARPDVMSVCHHHCPAFMPLLATGTDYVPIFHLGAVGGIKPPYWDQHDEFGDTNMLVVKPEEGASLARALGSHQMVLMQSARRHRRRHQRASDCVFRAVYSCRNAEYQVRAMTHRREHRLAFAGRNGACRRDQRQDHRAHALVGLLGDAGCQGRRAADCGQEARTAPPSRAAAAKRAAAERLGFARGRHSVLNAAHGSQR